MRADRILLPATALATAAAVAMVGAPAAGADVPTVGIGSAHTSALRDSFTVPVWTDAAGAHITAADATLTLGQQSVDVPLADPDGDGLWAPASPLDLPGADGGLGAWQVSVEATDSAGTSLTRADAGTLDHTDRVQLASLAATTGSYGDPDVVVSAAVQVLAPGSTTAAPAPAGLPVQVVPDGKPSDGQTLTTTDTGTVTSAGFTDGGGATYLVSTAVDTDTVHGTDTATVAAGYQQQGVRIVAKAASSRVSEGHPLTVSGTATIGGAAAADVPVTLSASSTPGSGTVVTTDDAGHFSGSVTAVAPYGGGTVTWTATATAPYLSGSATGTVDVPDPAAYTHVSITLASTGRITATGTIDRRWPGNAGVTYSEVTYLEYSPNGTTGWTALAHVTSFGGPGETFTVGAWASHPSGWYRVRHAQSDYLDATTSTPVHRARTETYVFGNNAAPEPIAKGRTITVTGTLKQYTGSWKAMPHTRIDLYFLPTGSHTYQFVTAGTTDGAGRVRLQGKATRSGYWQLHYFGDATHFDSGDVDDYVAVH